MMGRNSQKRDVRGRFAKMGDSIEDIENISAADVRPGMEVPRHSPAGDDLAQGGQWYPLRARNPVLVHPDDDGYHNGILRTAVRRSGPAGMDPSAYLIGLESHGTSVSGVTAEDGDEPHL